MTIYPFVVRQSFFQLCKQCRINDFVLLFLDINPENLRVFLPMERTLIKDRTHQSFNGPLTSTDNEEKPRDELKKNI